MVSHRTWTHIYVSKRTSLNLAGQGASREVRPSLQNDERIDENTRIFHGKRCIAIHTGKEGAGLEHTTFSLIYFLCISFKNL